MKLSETQIEILVFSLEGSKQTLDEALPEGIEWGDLTTEDHAAIDAQVFRCSQCGTWCPIDEENIVSDEQICNDCL